MNVLKGTKILLLLLVGPLIVMDFLNVLLFKNMLVLILLTLSAIKLHLLLINIILKKKLIYYVNNHNFY